MITPQTALVFRCLVDIVINNGLGQHRFTMGQRIRPDQLKKLAIPASPKVFQIIK